MNCVGEEAAGARYGQQVTLPFASDRMDYVFNEMAIHEASKPHGKCIENPSAFSLPFPSIISSTPSLSRSVEWKWKKKKEKTWPEDAVINNVIKQQKSMSYNVTNSKTKSMKWIYFVRPSLRRIHFRLSSAVILCCCHYYHACFVALFSFYRHYSLCSFPFFINFSLDIFIVILCSANEYVSFATVSNTLLLLLDKTNSRRQAMA